jgi:hypothetical protein
MQKMFSRNKAAAAQQKRAPEKNAKP